MKLSEVQALTPEQVRIELAKALGWTQKQQVLSPVDDFVGKKGAKLWVSPEGVCHVDLPPNWPSSLDALARDVWPEIDSMGLKHYYLDKLSEAATGGRGASAWESLTASPLAHAQAALVALTQEVERG